MQRPFKTLGGTLYLQISGWVLCATSRIFGKGNGPQLLASQWLNHSEGNISRIYTSVGTLEFSVFWYHWNDFLTVNRDLRHLLLWTMRNNILVTKTSQNQFCTIYSTSCGSYRHWYISLIRNFKRWCMG